MVEYYGECCPRCEANLTLQRGFHNTLSYWVCKGCGEMLVNPDVPGEIAWFCDECGEFLNVQEGFNEDCGTWTCTSCGHENVIDESEIYLSEEEFQSEKEDPYRGLSDEDMLALSLYDEESSINDRCDILLVRNMETGERFVKKILSTYDAEIYRYLQENPIPLMPRITGVYESDNYLIVIEQYIEGETLQELLSEQLFSAPDAVLMARILCRILKKLHSQTPPIIHRDIKPSNIMLGKDGRLYLLDMNAAKWYREGESEDTRLLGTQYYAAPEQLGYGFSASSEKTDIYALGVLLNVMVTGKLPKEEKAPEPIWSIVKNCISLDPESRYSDAQLLDALTHIAE